MSDRHRDSQVVHAGADFRLKGFRGTAPAIEASSAFIAESVDELYAVFRGEPGVVYSRLGNPTVMAFEHALAELEGARGAVAFASGMAAIHGAWRACGLARDDLVVASRDCYGSTLTLLRSVVARLGARERTADLCDTMNACALIAAERPKIVHCEVVSNPLLRVPDIDALAEAARNAGSRFIIDATFATPMLFRPFEHGADIVVHSATKYLGGHGDLTGGICAVRDTVLAKALRETVIVAGAVLSPFDAWLALRGMRTLALRMQRACDNAREIAAFLDDHPRVARVHYPGLPTHPHHDRAQKLLQECGGAMIAFELGEGTRESAMAFLERLELVKPATTLGDVATLALHPATSSHRELDASELVALGIDEALLRLSIGIENARDIIADLERALSP
ncbi:MAG TPA: PLP-dependent aspartate aminotransferase family protein [Polyangiaceae bacterium]|nr:PLP-dependent aspartate aminotransferase family protein [Polyangiaceae bacterium]